LSAELNKIIDNHLPSRPKFMQKEVVVGEQAFKVYFHHILDCIRALYGNPKFAKTLAKTKRAYHEMHTGEWWWEKQVNPVGLCNFLDLG
jgi:hypothetical protein